MAKPVSPDIDGARRRKPSNAKRFRVLDQKPAIPRPPGMSIARFIMSFPELVQQHRRQMLLLLLARFGIRDDGVVREADLRKLLDAMLPYYVPAMGEVNIDDIGMPVTGRPRKLTTAMYEEIAARVADGMSIKAACRSLAGDDPVRAHALAAQFHRMRKLQERYL